MGIENLRRKVNNKYKKQIMVPGNVLPHFERFSWGSLSLDVETGGGIPEGKITSVIGEFSDGKSAICQIAVGEYLKKYDGKKNPKRDVVWIDAEGAFDLNWARCLGCDPDIVEVVRPEYAQQAFDIANMCIMEDVGLVVIDSIAALVPKEEAEADMESWQIGLQARLNRKFMRKAHSALHNYDETATPTTLLYINQLTTDINSYGAPSIEPGGKALRFAPSLKVQIRKGDLYPPSKSIKDEGVQPKAQEIKFHVTKNKTAPPFRRGHFWFYFDTMDEFRRKGTYDRLEELIRYARVYDIVKPKGDSKSWLLLLHPGTGEIIDQFNGSSKLAKHLRDTPEAWAMVETEVMKAVQHDLVHDKTPISEDPEDEQRETAIPTDEELLGLELDVEDYQAAGERSSETV